MLIAADGDGNTEIDFKEFADILRGVKAANAAMVIETRFRTHSAAMSASRAGGRKERAALGGGSGGGALAGVAALAAAQRPPLQTPRSAAAVLSKLEFGRLLGDRILSVHAHSACST